MERGLNKLKTKRLDKFIDYVTPVMRLTVVLNNLLGKIILTLHDRTLHAMIYCTQQT